MISILFSAAALGVSAFGVFSGYGMLAWVGLVCAIIGLVIAVMFKRSHPKEGRAKGCFIFSLIALLLCAALIVMAFVLAAFFIKVGIA